MYLFNYFFLERVVAMLSKAKISIIIICMFGVFLLSILFPVEASAQAYVAASEDSTTYTADNWMDAYNYLLIHGTGGLATNDGGDSPAYAFVRSVGVADFASFIQNNCKDLTNTSDKWQRYILYIYKTLSNKYGVSEDMSVGSSNSSFFVFNKKVLDIYKKQTGETDVNLALESFDKKIGFVANICLVLGILTCILAFLINLGKVAIMPSHPIQRRKVIIDLATCSICIALLGSVRLLVFLAYYAVFA